MTSYWQCFRFAFLMLAMSTGLGACTVTPVSAATASNPPAEPPPKPLNCDESKARSAIGLPLDDALLAKVLADTGAKKSRILKPGMMVTNEFDGARVNLRIDTQRIVLGITCG